MEPGCEERYGYTRAEAIGKRREKLLGTTVGGSAFDGVKSELLKDGHWTGELDQRTKDGRSLKVVSCLQLESFDDRNLVIEHSDRLHPPRHEPDAASGRPARALRNSR